MAEFHGQGRPGRHGLEAAVHAAGAEGAARLDDDMPECPTEDVDGRCMVASSNVFVIPDSINIANALMKPYPDACYVE